MLGILINKRIDIYFQVIFFFLPNMSCFICCTRGVQTRRFADLDDDNDQPPLRQQDELQEEANPGVKVRESSRIKFVHFTLMTLNETIIDILNEFDEDIHVS